MVLSEHSLTPRGSSDTRDAYINMGLRYSRLNRFPEAMACCEKAREMGEDYLDYLVEAKKSLVH